MPKKLHSTEPTPIFDQLLSLHGIVYEDLDWTPKPTPDPEPPLPIAGPHVVNGFREPDYMDCQRETYRDALCFTPDETPEEVTSVIPRIVDDLPHADRPQL